MTASVLATGAPTFDIVEPLTLIIALFELNCKVGPDIVLPAKFKLPTLNVVNPLISVVDSPIVIAVLPSTISLAVMRVPSEAKFRGLSSEL